MAINNQDKTEIHNLPEVTTLQPGMMVAVDSEPTGSKSFNLTTALEGKASADDISALETELAEKADASDVTAALEGKVDAPATTPAEGQVLTFNGSANTWANPPEGVYVLNYSEVNYLTNIDIPRAKSQPTYIKIDEGCGDVTINIPYDNGSVDIDNYSIVLKVGTILNLSNIRDGNNEFVFTTVYQGVFYGGSSIGSYGTFFPVLYIRNDSGYLYKWFTASGELNSGSLNMSMPTAFTKFYRTGRGNGGAATDRNALEVQFQWLGHFRKQCLLPGEVSTHDFATDETPEQIQFMGWGTTTNRAGYKTLLSVKDETDSSTYPEQTPKLELMKFSMSNRTPDADQIGVALQTLMKSADGQTTETIGGIFVPPLSNAGVLQVWYDAEDYIHYGWKPIDTNLLVDVARPLDSTKEITATKTYAEIKQAVESGKHVILRVQEGATPGYIDAWTEYYTIQSYADDNGTICFIEDAIFPSVSSSDNRYNTVETRNNIRMLAIFRNNTWKSYAINPSSGIRTDAPKTVSTSTVDVKNNMITPISTSQSTLTVNCIYANEDAPNFVVEITPTSNLVLTVTASDKWRTETTTLKHSVAGGNTLEANKTYQVTAVGNCWTLAEFEA